MILILFVQQDSKIAINKNKYKFIFLVNKYAPIFQKYKKKKFSVQREEEKN